MAKIKAVPQAGEEQGTHRLPALSILERDVFLVSRSGRRKAKPDKVGPAMTGTDLFGAHESIAPKMANGPAHQCNRPSKLPHPADNNSQPKFWTPDLFTFAASAETPNNTGLEGGGEVDDRPQDAALLPRLCELPDQSDINQHEAASADHSLISPRGGDLSGPVSPQNMPTPIELGNNLPRVLDDIVVCTTPPATFAEAIDVIAVSETVPAKKIVHLRECVNWFQKRLPRKHDGSPADPLPCDPKILKPILHNFSPGRLKIGQKRWSSLRSQLASIQRKTGWLPPKSNLPPPASSAWIRGVDFVLHDCVKAMFRRFASFCELKGIKPDEVREVHFAEYRAYLETADPRLNSTDTVKSLRYAWNRLQKDHPTWGGLPLPKKQNARWIRHPDDNIPNNFFSDLDEYCAKLRNPGLFTTEFPAKTAESTIATRRDTLMLSAAVLVKKGYPSSSLTALGKILTPAAVIDILTAYHERNCTDGKWTHGAVGTASILKIAAKQWGKLSPEDIQEVERICNSVKVAQNGFSPKVLERLGQFDDKKIERGFLNLAKSLWKKAKKLDNNGKHLRAAQLAKYAVAIAIVLDKPLRRANLACLDLDLDFARDAQGKIIGIRIKADRTTKNAPLIEAALSTYTQSMITTFNEKYRPRLLTRPSTALFPGQKNNYVHPKGFGRELTAVIWNELGITVNPHLIRAYIATLILDDDPRDLVLVQRMLDHKSQSTGIRNYAVQRGRAVNGKITEVLGRKVRRLSR